MSNPSACSSLVSVPITSARPPVFAKGAHSAPAIKIRGKTPVFFASMIFCNWLFMSLGRLLFIKIKIDGGKRRQIDDRTKRMSGKFFRQGHDGFGTASTSTAEDHVVAREHLLQFTRGRQPDHEAFHRYRRKIESADTGLTICAAAAQETQRALVCI